MRTKHLGDGQNDIGGGHSGRNRARKLEPDNTGNQHRDGLAKHRGLRFDTAHTPAQNPKAIDHGGVRVSAHTSVGECLNHTIDILCVRDFCQVFDVYLVNDASAGGDHFEVAEGCLSPAQELVALTVALVLDVDVAGEGIRLTKKVSDHGVVDDKLCR